MNISELSNNSKSKEILQLLESDKGPKTVERLCLLTEDGLKKIGFNRKKDIDLLKKLLSKKNLRLNEKGNYPISFTSPIDDLELPAILFNSLLMEGIYTIGELCGYPENYIKSLRNIGNSLTKTLILCLKKYDFKLIEYNEIKVTPTSCIEDLRLSKSSTYSLKNYYKIRNVADILTFSPCEVKFWLIDENDKNHIHTILSANNLHLFDPIEKDFINIASRIENLKLNQRILSALLFAKIKTISQLCNLTRKDLQRIVGLNNNDIEKIISILKKHSFSLSN